MALGRIQQHFMSVAAKQVNLGYIAKIAAQIEKILRTQKPEPISPNACEFVVGGKSSGGERTFKLMQRKGVLGTTLAKVGDIKYRSESEHQLGLLGWALSECGVQLHKSIGKTGLPVKHLGQFGMPRDVAEVIAATRKYRKLYGLIR